MKAYEESLNLDPFNSHTLLHLAKIFFENGNAFKAKDFVLRAIPSLSYNTNILVGDDFLRMSLPYDGDIKCFINGFKYDDKKDNFYITMINVFMDNGKSQESYLCSR